MSQPMIVFHSPRPFEHDPRAGSSAHVTRMAEAFRAEGYDVEMVVGYSPERRASMRRVRRRIQAGDPVEFAYSEAATAPTSLNDRHHLPVHPFMDWWFLRGLRRHAPVGLFYPDVYWRFDMYRTAVAWYRRWPAVALYRFDLLWYRDAVDVLFLPSKRMAAYVPGWEDSDRVEALAPGGMDRPLGPATGSDALELFYVGSVQPPLYGIGPLLDAVIATDGVRLTVCCPAEQSGALGPAALNGRVTVVHESGDQLIARYAHADIACLFFEQDEYRSFAMPVKLFEALGVGRPVIASAGTAVGDFVEATGTGWVVHEHELGSLLHRLVRDRQLVEERRRIVEQESSRHRWLDRAQFVADRLRRVGPRGRSK